MLWGYAMQHNVERIKGRLRVDIPKFVLNDNPVLNDSKTYAANAFAVGVRSFKINGNKVHNESGGVGVEKSCVNDTMREGQGATGKVRLCRQ